MSLKRVLVVDDEEDLTWSISKHLAKDKEKYELLTANSGTEALEVISQLPIQLVITDIRMPEISGLDLLLKIKENYPATRVIIMTAYGSSEVQDEANKRGCFKYIEKPFEIHELRQMILDALEEKKGFEGKISDFQLSDLIQMNCLGRLTNALHVRNLDQKGVIFFEDGNIVHTEVDGVEGENAFYEILTWEGGSFSVEKGIKAPKETIIKGWQTLLLDGMKRADEIRNPEAREMEQEKLKKQQKIANILGNFTKNKGVQLAAIFDIEGFPLASFIPEPYKEKYQISVLSPLISSLIKMIETVSEEIKMPALKDVIIEYENGFMKIDKIPDRKDFFVVISENSTTLGLMRMETKKYIKELAGVL